MKIECVTSLLYWYLFKVEKKKKFQSKLPTYLYLVKYEYIAHCTESSIISMSKTTFINPTENI